MKKSTVFKILTLFLTVVIFSCCSGCFLSFVAYTNEKELQELLEIERQRKEQADALIPEVEGYTFEALPEVAFANQEDWESQGFLKGLNFFEKLKPFETKSEFTTLEDGARKITISSVNRIEGKEELTPLGYIIITPEQEEKYGSLFPDFGTYHFGIYDEQPVFFRFMKVLTKGWGYEGGGVYALFLVDFENHTLYYAGYSKGWIEAELNDNRLYNFHHMCFKLTKN